MVFAKQPQKRTIKTIIRELVDRTNTDTARIRILEQQADIVKSRMESVEQNVVTQRKQTEKTVSEVSAKTEEINNRVTKLESTIRELIKEIKKLASVSNIKELESLVDMYSPLKSEFLTRDEVERLIEKKLEEAKKASAYK
ncbi:MAG: hypothetical protein DRO99_00530 [Candidatus Aenigmatarchaeota archaeon]|nr:MAG: hypothetical protein DRO99_00530 [Candidatus Aenigmarchaeota archaeon]